MVADKIGLLFRGRSERRFWNAYSNALSLLGLFLSSVLLAVMLASYLRAAYINPLFVPSSTVEEWAYNYTTSQNYLTYGFFNSGLLQDTSNSPIAADHPYVYTHMPAGPDLVMASILKVTGKSYFTLRLIFAVLFILGIWYYYRFAKLILDSWNLPGAGFVIVFVGPIAWLSVMERSVYALFPLLAFAPYVALDAFYRTGKRGYLLAVAAVAFLSSIYIEYSLLTAVLVSWIALYFTKLIRIERKHLFLVIGAISTGIALHGLQNLLFLGPEVFFKDLAWSLGNRTIGYPRQEELAAFYHSEGILHHGSKPLQPLSIIMQIIYNFGPTRLWWFCLTVAGLVIFLCATIRVYRPGRFMVSLGSSAIRPARAMVLSTMWMAATIIAPILVFPAYSQEVSLNWSRANFFYIAIVQYLFVAFALKELYAASPLHLKNRGRVGVLPVWGMPPAKGARDPRLETLSKYVLWGGLVWVVAHLALHVMRTTSEDYRQILRLNLGANPYHELEDLKHFSGNLYATNVNTPIVGFFTTAPGFGVCDNDAITPLGTLNMQACQVSMMRDREAYLKKAPRYFFLFGREKFTPGFAKPKMLSGDGYKQLEQRLQENFAQIHENQLFRVFDLHRRAKGQ